MKIRIYSLSSYNFLILLFLFLSCNSNIDKVTVQDEDNFISFSKGGKQILSYQTTGSLPRKDIRALYLRGGYLHPVYTPSGKLITDDYPENHVHHHGIWSSWTKTEFEGRTPDFWNMGDSTGTVQFVKVDSVFSGEDFSGFKATHQYIDLTAPEKKPALEENWIVKIHNIETTGTPYYLFDLEILQNCATSSALILPEYHYGGLGFRGHGDWNGVENVEFLTSEGKTRSNGNETRAKWCHIGGLVDGEWAGITIMNHKSNFRFPQPVRLHPNEPFFCYAPSQLGDWAIKPEEQYTARYRFIVYDGKPDTVMIGRLWNDYINE